MNKLFLKLGFLIALFGQIDASSLSFPSLTPPAAGQYIKLLNSGSSLLQLSNYLGQLPILTSDQITAISNYYQAIIHQLVSDQSNNVQNQQAQILQMMQVQILFINFLGCLAISNSDIKAQFSTLNQSLLASAIYKFAEPYFVTPQNTQQNSAELNGFDQLVTNLLTANQNINSMIYSGLQHFNPETINSGLTAYDNLINKLNTFSIPTSVQAHFSFLMQVLTAGPASLQNLNNAIQSFLFFYYPLASLLNSTTVNRSAVQKAQQNQYCSQYAQSGPMQMLMQQYNSMNQLYS